MPEGHMPCRIHQLPVLHNSPVDDDVIDSIAQQESKAERSLMHRFSIAHVGTHLCCLAASLFPHTYSSLFQPGFPKQQNLKIGVMSCHPFKAAMDWNEDCVSCQRLLIELTVSYRTC